MPKTTVYFFKTKSGDVPVFKWLDEIKIQDKKTASKCFAAIESLKTFGYELRRPHADYLRDGIYELRISLQGNQYRLLYFYFGKNIVIVVHGLIKKQKVPKKDIELAINRKTQYESSPNEHTYIKEEQND